MADIALRRGGDMVRGFTGGGHSVVAGGTSTAHVDVTEADVLPIRGRLMTFVALRGGGNVSRILTGGGNAVVAVRTVTGGIAVIEAYRLPVCLGGMADVTL